MQTNHRKLLKEERAWWYKTPDKSNLRFPTKAERLHNHGHERRV